MFINSLCEFCDENFSLADLEMHSKHCEKRPRQCSVPSCNFSTCEPVVALMHLLERHQKSLQTIALDSLENLAYSCMLSLTRT